MKALFVTSTTVLLLLCELLLGACGFFLPLSAFSWVYFAAVLSLPWALANAGLSALAAALAFGRPPWFAVAAALAAALMMRRFRRLRSGGLAVELLTGGAVFCFCGGMIMAGMLFEYGWRDMAWFDMVSQLLFLIPAGAVITPPLIKLCDGVGAAVGLEGYECAAEPRRTRRGRRLPGKDLK